MAAQDQTIPTGSAAAAFVAAGIGCVAVGFFTTLAQAIGPVKNLLNWWNPAGPLTGKTGVAVMVWLASWFLLHQMWKAKDVDFRKAFRATLILIGLGLLGTFPTFFEFFG